MRSELSAPKEGLHLWVLHSRSFLFMYRLCWCKHGTTVKGIPEFPQIYTDGTIRRCMKTASLQASTPKWAFCTKTRITLWVLHSRSFLFMYTLRWCKHGTTVKCIPEFPQIYTDGTIRRCMKTACFLARTAKWAFCTKTRITFLGSQYP